MSPRSRPGARASCPGSRRTGPGSRSSRLLAEPVRQRLEALARVRLQEVVVLEPADPRRRRRRQRVELVSSRFAAISAASGRVGVGSRGCRPRRQPRHRRPPRPRPGRGVGLASSRRWTPERSASTISSSSLRDVRQRVRQRALPQELLALLAEAVEEVAQARRSPRDGSLPRSPRCISRRMASATSPSSSTSSASASHDLVGVEVGQVLRAVPARVA